MIWCPWTLKTRLFTNNLWGRYRYLSWPSPSPSPSSHHSFSQTSTTASGSLGQHSFGCESSAATKWLLDLRTVRLCSPSLANGCPGSIQLLHMVSFSSYLPIPSQARSLQYLQLRSWVPSSWACLYTTTRSYRMSGLAIRKSGFLRYRQPLGTATRNARFLCSS